MRIFSKHPLARYLRRTKTSLRALARKSGVDASTIVHVLKGRRTFSGAAALSIWKATGGAVDLDKLLKPMPTPRRRAA